MIEPHNSDFNTPVVLVGKKDGTIKFCIDFRKLNAFTKFDPESITNKDAFETGSIEPPNSDFNSPVIIAGEKDRTNRFCIDFRK